jgi:hypothetical protein
VDASIEIPDAAVEALARKRYEATGVLPLGPWPPPVAASGNDYAESYRDLAREDLADILPSLTDSIRGPVEAERDREAANVAKALRSLETANEMFDSIRKEVVVEVEKQIDVIEAVASDVYYGGEQEKAEHIQSAIDEARASLAVEGDAPEVCERCGGAGFQVRTGADLCPDALGDSCLHECPGCPDCTTANWKVVERDLKAHLAVDETAPMVPWLPTEGEQPDCTPPPAEVESPEQVGRRIREETETNLGGRFDDAGRRAVESVIADVARDAQRACPSCGSPDAFVVRTPCSIDSHEPDDWHRRHRSTTTGASPETEEGNRG